MVDQKPPRLAGDERATVRALLQYQRESLARKLAGVSEVSARFSPVGSGTNLLWLVKHTGRAERAWVLHRFAGQDEADLDLDDTVSPEDTVEAVLAVYRATWAPVDAVMDATPSLDTVGQREPVTLRWVVMHLLEETARHAGHADILRELIDGSTGR